jgi:hypothetical protein
LLAPNTATGPMGFSKERTSGLGAGLRQLRRGFWNDCAYVGVVIASTLASCVRGFYRVSGILG